MKSLDEQTNGAVLRLHHAGCGVEDLGQAAAQCAGAYGVGPCLAVTDVELEHAIELHQAHALERSDLASLIGRRPHTRSRISDRVETLAGQTTRLTEPGLSSASGSRS